MKICSIKNILSLTLLISLGTSPVWAVQKGHLEYGAPLFDYSKLNKEQIQNEAEYYFNAALNAQMDKDKYLNTAMGKYYLLTKIDPSLITPYIQLGRIYDEKNINRLAKENFFHAINMNAKNPYANFYFGEFYFKRDDYKRALRYYRAAYNNGFNNNYEINYRMAVIYEKFADLVNAKHFYNAAYLINPKDTEIPTKIQSIDGLNYGSSEYYHFIRE